MIFLLFLLATVDGATALDEIRARFASRPMSDSLTAIERLARSAPNTDSGAQAAAWRGALAQQAGDLSGAEIWYRTALAAPPNTDGHRLGSRGLGDLALLRRNFRDARHHFELAATGAEGVLAHELAQKRLLAERLETRQRLEYLSWCALFGCLAYFLTRIWRGSGPLGIPTELVYVIPVYLLLVLGCLGRDRLVLRALIIAGAGSAILIGSAGLASRRAPPTHGLRWLQAGLMTAANAALFYAVLNRAGLLDSLLMPTP